MTGLNKKSKEILEDPALNINHKINIFWMRRDIRLEDNTALYYALNEGEKVIILFVFDNDILSDLPADDHRVSFIYDNLKRINSELSLSGRSLLILKGGYREVWKSIISTLDIAKVYINSDYEPYAIERDKQVEKILQSKGIELKRYKDQVIFEKHEVVKDDSSPYTVFTPYSRKWLSKLEKEGIPDSFDSEKNLKKLAEIKIDLPSIESIGFSGSILKAHPFEPDNISEYDKNRDYPYIEGTSFSGPYLRFGTISIRKLVKTAYLVNKTYLNELIWREFFMQILFFYPYVVDKSFRSKYDGLKWINDPELFQKWCEGKTGYPIVDAGMRQLNATGYMHNRVRMITAGFLCKHLLTDWRWGERYFAGKLFDYELSSNNGNWQWAAGTGCDAAPYFRVFNPYTQAGKFDKDRLYIKKWVPEHDTPDYPAPVVDHKFARERAIETYRQYLP